MIRSSTSSTVTNPKAKPSRFVPRYSFRMGNTVAWVAIAISVISACIATVAAWTNREKLRLDLYDRRFRIYESALTLYGLIFHGNPSPTTSDQRRISPELRSALYDFRMKAAEGQFLFSRESGVPELLQQFSEDAFKVVNGATHYQAGNAWEIDIARYEASLEPLREKMAPFLNFHSYSAFPRLLDGADQWP